MPVRAQLLEGDEQVVTALGAGPGDGAEHGEEEGVDELVIAGGVFEEQQGQRVGVLEAQVRSVLVDGVVQLAGNGLDLAACGFADAGTAAQGAGHRGLGNPGEIGNVERRRSARRTSTAFGIGHAALPCELMMPQGSRFAGFRSGQLRGFSSRNCRGSASLARQATSLCSAPGKARLCHCRPAAGARPCSQWSMAS